MDDNRFEKELGRWSILGDFLPLAQYVRRWRGKNNSLSIVFHWNFSFPNCPLLSRMVTCDLWLISCYAPTCNFIKQCLILRFEVTYTSAQAQIMWSTILYWYLFCCIGQNSLTLTNFETCISRAFDAIAPPLQVVCDQQVEMNDNKKKWKVKVNSESEGWGCEDKTEALPSTLQR